MKWQITGQKSHHAVYHSDCNRVILERERGQWWVHFDPTIAPNGITEHPADTLRQAKAIAEAAINRADAPSEIQGIHQEVYKRLSDGERYRAALEAIRLRCVQSDSVDSAKLLRLVDEALR